MENDQLGSGTVAKEVQILREQELESWQMEVEQEHWMQDLNWSEWDPDLVTFLPSSHPTDLI